MEKLSRSIYFLICFVFFLVVDLHVSGVLVREISRGYGFSNSFMSMVYVKNSGAAFSMLQDSRELLIILSVVVLTLLFLYVFNRAKSTCFKELFFISILSAGIAGNLHERIVFGFVRDFFQLNFVRFPIFNISDIFINIGVIALIIMVLIRKTK